LTESAECDPDENCVSLLAIGDVHLGTRPSSLPEDLDVEGVDPRALTPEAALWTAVERAVAEGVDAVLFAGDVVESTNARFEAIRPLESAVQRLLEAGIPVLGVAGNHDVEALPRLARTIEGFELIGEGGHWDRRVIEKAGRPALEILGWSFPERQVRASPVADLLRSPLAIADSGLPRIGLLHGDLDASGGTYAPFTSRELAEAGLDAWLLGHIHRPTLARSPTESGAGLRGYLGSLVGLDPGEPGPRGPWLVRVASDGEVVARQLSNAALRWERVDCPVQEDDGPEDVGDRLLATAERVAQEIQSSAEAAPSVLGLRPRLVGATRHYEALRRRLDGGHWRGATRQIGKTLVFFDKVLDGLELAYDLAALARGDDPPALLARKILILERPGKERNELLRDARSALETVANESHWRPLEEARDAEDPLGDAALARVLIRSGTVALSTLLAQRPPAPHPHSAPAPHSAPDSHSAPDPGAGA